MFKAKSQNRLNSLNFDIIPKYYQKNRALHNKQIIKATFKVYKFQLQNSNYRQFDKFYIQLQKFTFMEPNSKKDLKIDKTLRKRQNAKPEALQRYTQNAQLTVSLQQDPKNSTNQENFSIVYIDPLSQLKRAKELWQNLDNNYFKHIKHKSILLTRDLTSAQKLTNFFSIQSQLTNTFQNEQIVQYYPQLSQNTLIHVLFKSSTPFQIQLLSFSFANYIQIFSKRGPKNIQEQAEVVQFPQNYSIVPSVQKYKNPRGKGQISEQQFQQLLKIGNLQFLSNLVDEPLLFKIQKTQQIKQDMIFDEDINIELELWQNQALNQNSKNSIMWNNLISSHNQQIECQKTDFSDEIFVIKQSLMHLTILRYFEHGTKDKTNEMLKALVQSLKLIKPAKSRESGNKKFFQTDCKICFCSFNYDSNQVLYCDMCNTSFHLACYGLHKIPHDQEYFCDCCMAKKTQENLRKVPVKRVTCQICCKTNFPIKQIDGHFYHMTCLVIFNFITIKDGRIQLKDDLNHQKIIKKVIQSQMESNSCIFCSGHQGSETGMQFRCSSPGCQARMHPICAYINGCLFSVGKNMKEKKIDVNILCNKHDCERDYIQQSYLRRYMCNFKNTSQKSLQSFRTEYENEIQSRKQKLETRGQDSRWMPKLIIDTKTIRRFMAQRQQKNQQKNQQVVSTETRKMLQKFVKSNF